MIDIYVIVCLLRAEQHISDDPAGGGHGPDPRSATDETNHSERRAIRQIAIWCLGGWIVYVPLITGSLVASGRINRVDPAYFTTVAQIVPVLAIGGAVVSLRNFSRVVTDHPGRAAVLRTFFMTMPLALALGLGLSLVAVAARSHSSFLAGVVGGYVIASFLALLTGWLASLELDTSGDAANRSTIPKCRE